MQGVVVGWDEQVVGRAGEEGLDNVGGESARRSAGVRSRQTASGCRAPRVWWAAE